MSAPMTQRHDDRADDQEAVVRKMDELIQPAVEAIQKKEVQLIPERMEKAYYNWTDKYQDWCISRQLWWGHRIPAYYCDECGDGGCRETPGVCPSGGRTHFTQDPGYAGHLVFIRAVAFFHAGMAGKHKELEYFYPTDVLVTGYDIIFFWVQMDLLRLRADGRKAV